jgi:hypothetical protein
MKATDQSLEKEPGEGTNMDRKVEESVSGWFVHE